MTLLSYRQTSRQLFDDSLRESAGLLVQLAEHEIAEHGQLLGIELLRAETRPGPYGFEFQIWTQDMQAGYHSAATPTTPLLPLRDGRLRLGHGKWRALAGFFDLE